jgi:hypothetical protein
MSKCEFEGTIKPGGRFSEAEQIRIVLSYLTGKRIRVTIEEVTKRRSGNQNRYYWGVVIAYVRHMFMDAGNVISTEEVHEFLKQHVGGLERVITQPDGKRRVVVGSTARLSKMEMEDYLEKVRAWAAEFGTVIPLPSEHLISLDEGDYVEDNHST